MTAVTGCRQRGVVVVGVALRTGDSDVRSCEWERGVVVIEGRARPGGRVVACGTRGWESGRRVIGVRGSGIVCLMAGVAVGRYCCVVIVGVALRAGDSYMSAGEWEGACGVIEGRWSPCRGGVTE